MLPFFPEKVDNVTVTIGQNAVLKCRVENLQSYKVSEYVNRAFTQGQRLKGKERVRDTRIWGYV